MCKNQAPQIAPTTQATQAPQATQTEQEVQLKELHKLHALDEQKKHIKNLKNQIEEQTVALALGAGCSKPLGFPMWSGLNAHLFADSLQYEIDLLKPHTAAKKADYDRLQALVNAMRADKLKLFEGTDPLETVEYVVSSFLEEAYSPEMCQDISDRFLSRLIAELVDQTMTPQECPEIGPSLKLPLRKKDWKKYGETNTATAIAYLMAHERGIKNAMNYNFDPLVQEYLEKMYGKSSITHPGEQNPKVSAAFHTDENEIFHVHGFVKGKRHSDTGNELMYPKNSKHIVLTEDSYYYAEEGDLFAWGNTTQAYFLNNYHCLFVGFSGDDYNFRNILRRMNMRRDLKPSNDRHYIILTYDEMYKNCKEQVTECVGKDPKQPLKQMGGESVDEAIWNYTKALVNETIERKNRYWQRFGFVPLWMSLDEIPGFLTNLIYKK